jgi:hypothetical protein
VTHTAATVVLYGTPECHLCSEAREQLQALREGGLRFDLREVDISMDEKLHRRYLERIPVIAVDGYEVSELGLDAEALRARLDRVRT